MEIVSTNTHGQEICSSFLFEDHDVRVQRNKKGEILFAAKDVAEALEITWSGHTLSKIPDDWVTMVNLTTIKGERETTFINEAGVYKLAFRSQKPAADRFSNWVAGTVLPKLRKTGSYSTRKEIPSKGPIEQLSLSYQAAQSYHGLANLLGCSSSVANALTVQFLKRSTGLDVSELLAGNIADVQDPLVTPTDLGKEMGISARAMNKLLSERKLQDLINSSWFLTTFGKDYAQLIDTGKKHSNGTPIQQIKWYKDKTLNFIKRLALIP